MLNFYPILLNVSFLIASTSLLFDYVAWTVSFSLINVLNVCCVLCVNITCMCDKRFVHTYLNRLLLVLFLLSYCYHYHYYGLLCCYWTPGGSQKGPIKQGLSILLSFPPSFCPGVFLEFCY